MFIIRLPLTSMLLCTCFLLGMAPMGSMAVTMEDEKSTGDVSDDRRAAWSTIAEDAGDLTDEGESTRSTTAACHNKVDASLLSAPESTWLTESNKKTAGGGLKVTGWDRSRALLQARNFTFPGNLAETDNSFGNPNDVCYYLSSCINNCQSLFYKVTGGNGSTITASTCGTANFLPAFYVWEGNGTCASFQCVVGGYIGCGGLDTSSTYISWTSQAGAEYYVQVWGFGASLGTYALTVSSNDPIEVSESYVCEPPPPTLSPPDVTTDAPTGTPTTRPSEVPTDSPSAPPSKAPTVAPDPCVGVDTAYWLYDPTTNAPVRPLVNNSATCLLHPYNIEVRPCTTAASAPVRVRLLDTSRGSPTVVYKSKRQTVAPYVLFGPATTPGDVLPSPKPLPNGNYSVAVKGAPEWGRLSFAQACPCPDGTTKGKKGCMK